MIKLTQEQTHVFNKECVYKVVGTTASGKYILFPEIYYPLKKFQKLLLY